MAIETSPVVKAGTPRLLFEGAYFDSSHDYGVTPDGKGFIFIREGQNAPGPGRAEFKGPEGLPHLAF